jgi:hypothetical protein
MRERRYEDLESKWKRCKMQSRSMAGTMSGWAPWYTRGRQPFYPRFLGPEASPSEQQVKGGIAAAYQNSAMDWIQKSVLPPPRRDEDAGAMSSGSLKHAEKTRYRYLSETRRRKKWPTKFEGRKQGKETKSNTPRVTHHHTNLRSTVTPEARECENLSTTGTVL